MSAGTVCGPVFTLISLWCSIRRAKMWWPVRLVELEYQAEVAEWIGADVINIHAGGAYGDKRAALGRFVACLEKLTPRVRERLTVENDDTDLHAGRSVTRMQVRRYSVGLRRPSPSL